MILNEEHGLFTPKVFHHGLVPESVRVIAVIITLLQATKAISAAVVRQATYGDRERTEFLTATRLLCFLSSAPRAWSLAQREELRLEQ